MLRVIVTPLLGILCIAATAVAQEKKAITPGVEGTHDPRPVFNGIEKAWREANADAMAAYAGDSKIYLSVAGVERDSGFFSKSQFKYLFKKMFRNYRQTKFEFVRYHNIDRSDRKVYGIAHRNYKNSRSGRLVQDKVYVTLKREGTRWVVAEIKSTS
jgi:hypothetical protein